MHIMLDLETLGVRPGCAILSIGMVQFDVTGLKDKFYEEINTTSCTSAGLHTDPSTVAWWAKQSPSSRATLDRCLGKDCDGLRNVLERVQVYVQMTRNPTIWGNGADFDKPILEAAFTACGMTIPWKPYVGRCYRTLKNLYPGIKMKPFDGAHNALNDAKAQALHAVDILNHHENRA